MNTKQSYDIIVIGASAAGLSAARTAARLGFSTLVLERLAQPGSSAHPCSAILAPVSRASTDLYFRKIDLSIPRSLVLGRPTSQRWLSPARYSFDVAAGRAAVVDLPRVLGRLAADAARAGAQIEYGAPLTGLIEERGHVVGVRTAQGEIRSQVVISAEGGARPLAEAASEDAARYAFIMSAELEAPAAQDHDLGLRLTLGHRYTSARESFGMFFAPAPGKLLVHFCMFADGANYYGEQSLNYYLREYIQEDPRISELAAGAKIVRQNMARVALSPSAGTVVCGGFMVAGDALSPTGFLGLLPAVYLGRQAALTAAGAIEAGDVSTRRLAPYERAFRHNVLPALNDDAHTIATVLNLNDYDLDGLCLTLASRRLALPFFGQQRGAQWQTAGDMAAEFPAVSHDRDLFGDLLQQRSLRRGNPAALPLVMHAHTAAA